MAEYLEETLEQLIGNAKLSNDFFSTKYKVRYSASPTIVPGQVIQMRLPVYDDRMLDLNSLLMCFYLQGSSADPNACIDGQTIQTVVDRVRVLSGSTVLCDIGECALLFQSLYDINTEVNISTAFRTQVGDMTGPEKIAAFALAAPGRQYIAKLAPRDSYLNTKALLPIGRMSTITIELTFTSAAKSIYSPLNTLASTWIMTNFELHGDWIQSAKLSSYFSSHPFRITVTDYSQRLNSLLSATTGQIRISSANTSLDKVYTILRDDASSIALNVQNKNRVAKAGNLLMYLNVLCNGVWQFSDNVLAGGTNQSWIIFEEACEAWPPLKTVAFFTTTGFVTGTQNRLMLNFQNAPVAFCQAMQSGVNTAKLSTDIIIQVLIGSAMTARVDSFLCSSVTISLPRVGGDLKMEN